MAMASAQATATAPAPSPATAPTVACVRPVAAELVSKLDLPRSAGGSSDALPIPEPRPLEADQSAQTPLALVRTSSTSKLNAQAPEYVPKNVTNPPYYVDFQGPPVHPVTGLVPASFAVPCPQQQPAPLPARVMQGRNLDTSMVFGPPGVEQVEPQVQSVTASVSAASAKPVLTEELKSRIVKQVEFYFSEANLSTDSYLMKFVKKDPEGFVPVAVVASFRKIRNLAKNHGIVVAALRHSTALVVSDDGKRVRRAQPLPDVDLDEVQSRTVVAENLPDDHSIVEMEQLFGRIGNVKMVRICQPESGTGALQTAAKHPKADVVVSNKVHALVEYESVELAERAVAELTDERNWRSGLRVRLLLRRTFQSKHGYQQPPLPKARKVVGDTIVGDASSGGEEDDGPVEKGLDDLGQSLDKGDDSSGVDVGDSARRGRSRGSRGRGRSIRGQHVLLNSSVGGRGTSPQNCSPILNDVTRLPPRPRMPDGTRGFSLGRGRHVDQSNI